MGAAPSPGPTRTPPHAAVSTFYLPTKGAVHRAFAIPSQIIFAILGLLGMAHYSRQIVRVRPKTPGSVKVTPTAVAAGVTGGDTTPRGSPAANVDEWIVANTPSLSGTYKPSWWLPNGHMQTFFIVAGNFTKTDHVDYVRTLLRVPDGGTLALDITPPNHEELPADAPTVLVCHGLTGNANESYVRNVLAWVVKPKSEGGLGGRGVVSNFRGCGGQPITSTQMYSAAASCDVNTVSHFLRSRYPQSSMHGIGFSLGASVLSRHIGEAGDRSLLSSGCVLGCPWDITELSHALEDGWFSSRVYSAALGRNLLKMFFRNYDANPEMFERSDSRIKDDIPELRRMQKMGGKVRLRMVDNVMVRHIGGPSPPWPFKDAWAYYAYAGSHQLLHNVKIPLLGINAFDDPVVHGDVLPVPQVEASSHVHLAVTGSGGHLGWFDGPLFGKRRQSRWVVKPVAEFLTAAARDLAARGHVKLLHEDGWEWVDDLPRPIQTGAEPTRLGWRVLQEGVPLADWQIGEVTQGL